MSAQFVWGLLCIVLSALLFGFMPFLSLVAYSGGSTPLTVACSRFFFGLFFAAALAALQGHKFALRRRQYVQVFYLSLAYALTPLMLYSSYALIDSGLATTLHFIYPLAVIALMALLFHTRVSKQQLFCAALALCGIVALYEPSAAASQGFGMFLAAGSGVVYAFYVIALRRFDLREVPVFVTTFWLCVMAAAELLVLAILSGELALNLTPEAYLAELALALFVTVLAIALFQRGVFCCGEIYATLLSTLEPVTAVAVGLAVLSETLSLTQLVGITLILLSAVLLTVPRRHHRERAHP